MTNAHATLNGLYKITQ